MLSLFALLNNVKMVTFFVFREDTLNKSQKYRIPRVLYAVRGYYFLLDLPFFRCLSEMVPFGRSSVKAVTLFALLTKKRVDMDIELFSLES